LHQHLELDTIKENKMNKCRKWGDPIELDQYLKRDRLCTLFYTKELNKELS